MKNTIGLLFILLIFNSCATEPRTDYIINGNAKGVYNGIRVHLNEINQRGRQVAVNTGMVMNEKFTFNGKVEYPKSYTLTIDGVSGSLPLMIENANMTLDIDKQNLANSVFKGSPSHKIFEDYTKETTEKRTELAKLNQQYRTARRSNDTDLVESLSKKVSELNTQFNELPYTFIKSNTSSYAVISVLEGLTKQRNVDKKRIIELFNSLDTPIKEAAKKGSIGATIERFTKEVEAEKSSAIGAKAPDFTAPNPNGEAIALNDVVKKGKVTIVDFWAAWCGPCRRENPNVVNVYNKYHDKGLEIIGVGLDGRRGQQNPKEAWIKAIEDDKLTWHQVSNLKYFDDIAKSYNVKSIPAMFVLNSKGEIIAKNLRGVALENKIAELLN